MKTAIVTSSGGSVLLDKNLFKQFIEDISVINKLDLSVIVIHGGGKNIKKKLDKLNIKSKFIDGLRVTDERTIKVVEEALLELNSEIINNLNNLQINAVAKKEKCKTKIEYRVSGEAFYTKPNKEIYMVKKIVKKITGNSSKLNCRGGTSDSRFLGSIPRLELGLRNNTIHMVDERTSISDLKKLTKIYYNILENYF